MEHPPRQPAEQQPAPTSSKGSTIIALGALTHTCGPLAAIPAIRMARKELQAVDDGSLPESCRKPARWGLYLAWAGLGVWALFGALALILWRLMPGLVESYRTLFG